MGLSASSIPGSSQSTVLATPQLRARFRPRQARCQLTCSLPGTTAGRLQAEKHRSALLTGRIQASGALPGHGIATNGATVVEMQDYSVAQLQRMLEQAQTRQSALASPPAHNANFL